MCTSASRDGKCVSASLVAVSEAASRPQQPGLSKEKAAEGREEAAAEPRREQRKKTKHKKRAGRQQDVEVRESERVLAAMREL